MKSGILGRDVNYAVYLPPDYETSGRRYPVVYLLHGYTDDESGWIQFGKVNLAADRAIAAREIPPMIIVMPDGGATFYINDCQDKVRYEDMFIQELIPHIDKTYRNPAAEGIPRHLRPVHGRLGVAGAVHAPSGPVRRLCGLQHGDVDRRGHPGYGGESV